MIVFDIETGPLGDEDLANVAPPFEPPPHPGEFDESKVKYGKLGEEKRKEKREKALAEHKQAVEEYDKEVERSRLEWWQRVKSKAALSATTGQVLAVGYYSPEKQHHIIDIGPESALLAHFWEQMARFASAGRQMVGHNIAGFDLPFLIQRSWIHGLEPLFALIYERGRYLNSKLFADTMLVWACGRSDYVKLDVLCRALGIPGKLDGVDGSMFAELLARDPKKAEEYLKQDLLCTAAVAQKLGLGGF